MSLLFMYINHSDLNLYSGADKIKHVFIVLVLPTKSPHRWHNGWHAGLKCGRWWRAKTGRLRIRIMCPSGATCLLVDCCLSELAHKKSDSACWFRTTRTSSSFHWKLTRHDIAEKFLNWRLTTITHSSSKISV